MQVGERYDTDTAYDRAYLASVLCTFAQIPIRGTSDTLETMSERCVDASIKVSSFERVIQKASAKYFEVKESNYGYIFLLCLVYNFIQYRRLYIHDNSFKDTFDGLSAHLLSKRPPKAAALMAAALKEAYANIGYDGVNKMNDCLIEAILTSG